MTKARSNVVPFERPAAYWAVRARRHAAPGQLPDAAKLMRKALEKSGDGGLALELSQIYARMHCYTASERYLMRACVRQGLTGSVCFLVGCAALNRDQEDLGERALDLSLRLDPDGMYAEQAQEILESYPWRQVGWRPRCARGEELCYQAQKALLAGKRGEAAALIKRAWRRAHTPEIALQLGALLPPARGMIYLEYAARRKEGLARPWLLLAFACHGAMKPRRAKEALGMAAQRCALISDAEALCQTAWMIGEGAEALRFIDRQLESTPASVDYLYLRYLCLMRLGEKEKAGRTLEMLLEIDPDDASGLQCRLHPEDVTLDRDRTLMLSVLGSLVYAAPERLKRGPLNRILHQMVMMLDGVMDMEAIYRLLPPLWRRMTEAEKRACDEQRSRFYPAALAVCLLLMSGKSREARQYFEMTQGKKRLRRFLRRITRVDMTQNS